MIRLTHRRCRTETTALDAEAEMLTAQVESLTDDLQAAEHALEEIIAACRDLEYAATEAAIPDELRERLLALAEVEQRAAEDVEVLTA
ncbi:hypothetical protein [Nocardiopsis sp. L17-MgMaSL7]|uniref:hypothetical protein n=1 Tax=Nocardiopsis sp. L17-MgMaSL7 TaxID=1938893 RepID=UPI000D71C632|nr:hypothetical protein [Nocardiopsis sp. L17-MgMaSL7]PWV44551.1 hypothetical protein BDW27_12310 [Nocardiopsis sp. L17-MgMaSL7]